MFGARVVRQKRERERAERELLDLDGRQTIPYIKPFGERFDPSQLPYFKYRKALAELELERGACLEVKKIINDWIKQIKIDIRFQKKIL